MKGEGTPRSDVNRYFRNMDFILCIPIYIDTSYLHFTEVIIYLTVVLTGYILNRSNCFNKNL